MANIVLPQVAVLNNLNDNANLLVEQNGEINRFAIADLDIGGGDVTINLNGDSVSSPTGINADSLGGYPASEYAKLNDLSEYAKLNDLEDINTGVTMDLLWENASPTSAFAAQTIDINLSNYWGVKIIWNIIDTLNYTNTIESQKGTRTFIHAAIGASSPYIYTSQRGVTTYEDKLEFSDGAYGAVNTGAVTKNNCCIPIRIYGIKGVKI